MYYNISQMEKNIKNACVFVSTNVNRPLYITKKQNRIKNAKFYTTQKGIQL